VVVRCIESVREDWIEDYTRDKRGINVDKEVVKRSCREFIAIVHGDKSNFKNFLDEELNITGRYQVIYEIMQNSDDAESEHLLVYYDDKYLLFANDGKPFDDNDIRSICNIGQTTKHGCDKIGRFGIGFKLVYRLLGGVSEVMNYKAPIIFSWNDKMQIENLINFNGDITPSDKVSYPVIFKPILTAIPVGVDEHLYDLEGQLRNLFELNELKLLVDFINRNESLKDRLLKFERGSLFFIELEDYDDFKKNLEKQIRYVKASLTFLKYLKSVIINGEEYRKLDKIIVKDFTIKRGSKEWVEVEGYLSIDQRDCDLQIKVAYIPFSVELRRYPNLYKFLPISDERHGLNFLIHSNFEMEASRRRISEDREINRRIIILTREKLIDFLNSNKSNEKEFTELYYAILTSDRPDNEFIREHLYDHVIGYIKKNIPIKDKNGRFSVINDNKRVLIKMTQLKVDPIDFGINMYWFYYDDDNAIRAAKDSAKLNISNYCGIVELLEKGKVNKINEWLRENSNQYTQFLKELNEAKNIKSIKKDRLNSEIKWIRFDKILLSVKDILDEHNNYFIYNSKLLNQDLKRYLEKLGAVFTDEDFEKYDNLFNEIFDEYSFYSKIIKFINSMDDRKLDELSFDERKKLFIFLKERLKRLVRIEQREIKEKGYRYKQITCICPKCKSKRTGIDVPDKCSKCGFNFNRVEDLRSLKLFKNKNGQYLALNRILKPLRDNPEWLKGYEIRDEEYFEDLDEFLCKDDEVFQNIIVSEIENIIKNVKDLSKFYEDLEKYYRKAKDKNVESLKNKKFIKDAKGTFTEPTKVTIPFSNPRCRDYIKKCSNYNVLNTAIRVIFNKDIPQKDLIDVIANASLYKELIQDLKGIHGKDLLGKTFNKDEVLEILWLLAYDKSKIFEEDFCLVKEDEDKFKFVECSDKVVYTTEDKILMSILPKYEKFVEFPLLDEISSEQLEQLGVLVDKRNLTAKLLNEDLKSEDFKILSNAVKDLDKELKKRYITKALNYELPDLKDLGIDKFLNNLLKIALEVEVEVLGKLRDRLKYNSKPLNDFVLSKDVDIYDDLNIGLEIVPKNIVNNLKAIGFTDKDIEKLFKKYINYDEIYERLCKKGIIETSGEFAFILDYAKIKGNLKYIIGFRVRTKYKEINIENNILPFYIKELSFINSEYVLDINIYKNLNNKLKLGVRKPVFTINDRPVILLEPYFDGNEFCCYWIRGNLDDNTRRDLLKFIYSQWNESIKSIRIKGYSEDSYRNLFGFNPKVCISSDKYAYASERLPDWVKEWINEKLEEKVRKLDFLSSLGIKTERDPVVKLRMYFLDENQEEIDNEIIDKIEKDLLLNTLKFLATQRIKWNREKLKRLKSIYEALKEKLRKHANERIFIAYKEENGIKRYEFKSLKDVLLLNDHMFYYTKFKDKAWFVDYRLYPRDVLELLIRVKLR